MICFVVLILVLGSISCSKSLSTYDVVTLRSAANGADQAAKETDHEVIKIQNINKALKNHTRIK